MDDINQFNVVSHNPRSDLENLCENFKNKSNLSRCSHVDFDKLGKVEKKKVEEALYAMMSKFKTIQLEFTNFVLKSLYDIVKRK